MLGHFVVVDVGEVVVETMVDVVDVLVDVEVTCPSLLTNFSPWKVIDWINPSFSSYLSF